MKGVSQSQDDIVFKRKRWDFSGRVAGGAARNGKERRDLSVVLIAVYCTCLCSEDDHTLDFIITFLVFTLRPLIIISSHPSRFTDAHCRRFTSFIPNTLQLALSTFVPRSCIRSCILCYAHRST